MTRRAVYNSLNTFYVRFPRTVAASVRVTHLNTKSNTFTAKFTLCHLLHLLAINEIKQLDYNNRRNRKMQEYFENTLNKLFIIAKSLQKKRILYNIDYIETINFIQSVNDILRQKMFGGNYGSARNIT